MFTKLKVSCIILVLWFFELYAVARLVTTSGKEAVRSNQSL